MIIIYQGKQSYLPLAVGYLHFHHEANVPPYPGTDWWRRDELPLSVIGIDRRGHVVCSLVTGYHGAVYQRAIQGMAEIFNLDVVVIDIDKVVCDCLQIMSLSYMKFFLSRAFPLYWGSVFIDDLHSLLGRTSILSEVGKGQDVL